MVEILQLDEKTYVAGQIWPQDLPDIAASGIKLIVDNRPDGEDPACQASAAEIKAAAAELGIAFAYLPFTAPTLTAEDAAQFAELLSETDGPVLAYCRTGNRSSMLWAAAHVALGASLEDVIGQAYHAGYDLRPAAQFIYSLGTAAAGG